jgi:hypothetical protein
MKSHLPGIIEGELVLVAGVAKTGADPSCQPHLSRNAVVQTVKPDTERAKPVKCSLESVPTA